MPTYQETPCQCCSTSSHSSDSCLLHIMNPKHQLMQSHVEAKLASSGSQEGEHPVFRSVAALAPWQNSLVTETSLCRMAYQVILALP